MAIAFANRWLPKTVLSDKGSKFMSKLIEIYDRTSIIDQDKVEDEIHLSRSERALKQKTIDESKQCTEKKRKREDEERYDIEKLPIMVLTMKAKLSSRLSGSVKTPGFGNQSHIFRFHIYGGTEIRKR